MLYRQGDIFIESVADAGKPPPEDRRIRTGIIVLGEATGHAHRLDHPSAAILWAAAGAFFLRVTGASVRIVHEEHRPLALGPGDYRIWRQREYVPHALPPRTVVD